MTPTKDELKKEILEGIARLIPAEEPLALKIAAISAALDRYAEGSERAQAKNDLPFLKKMRGLSQELMGKFDFVTAQYLDKMIEDWIDELTPKTQEKKP